MNVHPLKIKSRLWIEGEEETFLSKGRVALLQEVEAQGSISKAARSMKMSYVKAWKLIDSMNKRSDVPLVVKSPGGISGGGTVLTDKGREAIVFYEKLRKKCELFLEEELKKLIAEP